jgi:methyltransferase
VPDDAAHRPLLVCVSTQAGRVWVIASLGRRWTTRLIVPRRSAGHQRPLSPVASPELPDRYRRLAILPLAFNAFAIAVAFSVCNAALLLRRIRIKRAALDFPCEALPR